MIELEYLESIKSGDNVLDLWAIIRENETIGTVQVSLISPELLKVEDIVVKKDLRSFFGPSAVRKVLQTLKDEYPKVQEITGIRISGARARRSSLVGAATGVRELPESQGILIKARV